MLFCFEVFFLLAVSMHCVLFSHQFCHKDGNSACFTHGETEVLVVFAKVTQESYGSNLGFQAWAHNHQELSKEDKVLQTF